MAFERDFRVPPGAIKVAVGIAVLAVILLIASCMVTIVPPGHVGVKVLFGKVDMTETLPEGLSFVNPLLHVEKMSVQTLQQHEVADTPTKEGLTVHLEATLLYHLDKSRAAEVFQGLSANYAEVVIIPSFRSALRDATSEYDAKALYTAARGDIDNRVFTIVLEALGKRGIIVEKLLLRSVTLPQTVKAAVEEKLAAEQQVQQMQFTLDKAKLEANRRVVEAQGIADAQKIISGTLSEPYIRYLWIQALEKAAASPSTVIYVPTGSDGMPIFKPLESKAPK